MEDLTIAPPVDDQAAFELGEMFGRRQAFGPSYFELAQLTRITPEQFRAIAPAIRDQRIHTNGEAIALIPENAEKIAAAVAGLRREAAPPEPVSAKDDAAYIVDRRCAQLLSEIRQVVRAKPKGTNKIILRSTIQEVILALRTLDLEMGI